MEVGISLSSTTRARPDAAGRHLIARARAAAAAELDSLSLGDGHAHGGIGYLQNTPSLGRLLAEWSGRPAGCLFLLPMWPPVLVAEQVGTLAALHDGPFIVQTGIGGSPAQFAALGASTERRVTVFEEGVRIVDGLLRGETMSSELFSFTDVSIGLLPHQSVDWWMGTMSSAGVRRAARFGAAWYAAPGALPEPFVALDEEYRAACEERGTSPRVMLRRDMLVLADGDQARRSAGEAVARGYRGMNEAQLVVGTPDEAAEQLRVWSDLGVDQIVARTMGLSPEHDLETIECLAEVRRVIG
jgi:alkanesulfonate monooxygenase SsuD/methylene tetrahydromethanopterin reductase-like flavin-dependent oxidoreductase (luciferase family)